MANGGDQSGNTPLDLKKEPLDLQKEMEKRKTWFFECQLRGLNMQSFRGATAGFPDPLLDLISEPLPPMGFPGGQIGVQMGDRGRIYLDSQQPVWDQDEHTRRDTLAQEYIGQICNWLDYKEPHLLAEKVADLKKKFEASPFASAIDLDPAVSHFPRKETAQDSGNVAKAISRARIAEAKPWLIPELYTPKHPDSNPPLNWLENLEHFILDFESELQIAIGGASGLPLPFDRSDSKAYRSWIHFLLDASTKRDTRDAAKAGFLDQKKNADGKGFQYQYNIKIQTNGYPLANASDFPYSFKVKYWTSVIASSLKEVYLNKADSDMGLCLLIRVLYLFGTMPEALASGQPLIWRKRVPAGDAFTQFFNKRAEDKLFQDDAGLLKRLRTAEDNLRTILEESAAMPRSAAIWFSPLTQEILRQGIHSYKFWMDEPFRAKDNGAIAKARGDVGLKHPESEMEYWSENHYIMFASSEYLAGQLWEADRFQPAREFLPRASRDMGVVDGKARKERGRARVLKWLNNRLMFGWAEFNSSGYYREHLWALLNLADFALDREVRDKAWIAIDLLLFDAVRFTHKGTIGAAGGRCQFKSKVSGWDNALGDVIEILLGTRGVFSDGDALIGCSVATTTYEVPDVLLQIGVFPPTYGFVDRARVSISFEEAPKYDISYSKTSNATNSLRDGYASKRRRYYPFLDAVNQEIARTHSGYGASHDDTIFWWGTSAFFNKQVVKATFDCVETFGLDKTGIFATFLPLLIKYLIPLIQKATSSGLGGLLGGFGGLLGGGLPGVIAGGGAGFVINEFVRDDLEDASDEISVFLEGSTRTRANILTYRNGDVMLSSLQNFRAGQLNYQSSVNQATLNGALNVFTTAGFAGIDISDLFFGGVGLLAGSAVGLPVEGAIGGVVANEAFLQGMDLLRDDDDGPGWWTGYWALPMIVQHRSAAIIAYDYDDAQESLAETGSHLWFPKAGFARVEEARTSAYDDDNLFLLDIGDIGPKGFWLFGKVVHPKSEPAAENTEAYVGVFSNQRPDWLNLDEDADVYSERLKKKAFKPIDELQEKIDDKLDDLEDEDTVGYVGRQVVQIAVERAVAGAYARHISLADWGTKAKAELAGARAAIILKRLDKLNELVDLYVNLRNLQRIWSPLPMDYFADRDWYVDGKNIWVIQVGSKEEFGSFEQFKNRVTAAKIKMDDAGDVACSYDIPMPDGSSQTLSLDYEDGGSFQLNGGEFQTDLYPRFENPFVRSGIVEWGQREYLIEYNGKNLLHDLSEFSAPTRSEKVETTEDGANTVRALVIYLRTQDEEMEEFTVATATARIGCETVTVDQVIAAGPVDEDTTHDAEWIYFDKPAPAAPDLTLTLKHPARNDADDTPEWEMRFSLRALMGDYTLRDCTLSRSSAHFEGERRTIGPYPFSIRSSKWRPWEKLPYSRIGQVWTVANRKHWSRLYYEYCDLVAIDERNQLRHRRLPACLSAIAGWNAVGAGGEPPDLSGAFSVHAISTWLRNLVVWVVSRGTLFAAALDGSGNWGPWLKVEPWVFPVTIFGLPDTSAAPLTVTPAAAGTVFAGPSLASEIGAELFLCGADGNVYLHLDWHPLDRGPWRKIEVSGFTLLPEADCEVAGDLLFVLGADLTLWSTTVNRYGLQFIPVWEKISFPGLAINRFTVAQEPDSWQILATAVDGRIFEARYNPGSTPRWSLPGAAPGFHTSPRARAAWAIPEAGRLDAFAAGLDGRIYTNTRSGSGGWAAWTPVHDGGQGFEAAAVTPVVVHRVNRQLEVVAQSKDGEIFRTWWS